MTGSDAAMQQNRRASRMRVAESGYCPTCRCESLLSRSGACVWCDTVVATAPESKPRRSHAGIPVLMQDDVLHEARALYATGASLRSVAAKLHDRTDYSSVQSFAQALSDQFRLRGWPVRGRVEQVQITSTVHGRLRREARDPAYVRYQRLQRGEIRGVRCAAVRTQAPGKGQPCRRWAQDGSDYCYQHNPENAQVVAETAARARSRIGADQQVAS